MTEQQILQKGVHSKLSDDMPIDDYPELTSEDRDQLSGILSKLNWTGMTALVEVIESVKETM